MAEAGQLIADAHSVGPPRGAVDVPARQGRRGREGRAPDRGRRRHRAVPRRRLREGQPAQGRRRGVLGREAQGGLARPPGRTGLVCAGGSTVDAKTFLTQLWEQIHVGGAIGNATGRNIHQRALDEAVRLTKAICAITLGDWTSTTRSPCSTATKDFTALVADVSDDTDRTRGTVRITGRCRELHSCERLRPVGTTGRTQQRMPISDWFTARESARYTQLSDEPATAAADVPDGVWVKCDGCKHTIYEGDLEENLRVCPHCGHHFDLHGAAAHRAARRRGHLRRVRRATSAVRPAALRRGEAVRRVARWRRARQVGLPEAVVTGARAIDGHDVVLGGDGLPLHRRVDGLGRRREDRARVRARDRRAAADRDRHRLGRRAHAGGHALAHADGEDVAPPRGATPTRGCPTSRCSPTPPTAASPRRSRCSPTSSSPSRER